VEADLRGIPLPARDGKGNPHRGQDEQEEKHDHGELTDGEADRTERTGETMPHHARHPARRAVKGHRDGHASAQLLVRPAAVPGAYESPDQKARTLRSAHPLRRAASSA